MKTFKTALLDVDKLVKMNKLQEVTNPIYFIRSGVPTSDGLLSNEIFGITKFERANKWAYIDLAGTFLNPYIYKIWCSIDKNIIALVHGTQKFKIDANGYLYPDEAGSTGVDFLKKNINKIKIKATDSNKRDTKIKTIMDNKKDIFITKCPVIPAFYRDVDTKSAGKIGVGDLNKIYDNLIMATRALRETADYGLSLSNSAKGRVQDLLLDVYEWLTMEPNLFKKKGNMRRAMMSKTTDYASRLVITAPNLRVKSVDDLMVDLDYSALPLASACVNLYPQILFWLRRFFENQFSGNSKFPRVNPTTKKIEYAIVKDPQVQFSDTALKKQIDLFIKSYSNRFAPLEIEYEDGVIGHMMFKGNKLRVEDFLDNDTYKGPKSGIIMEERWVTWCDLLYMAAVESAKGKHALITRFPMDSYFNQFPTRIRISSTLETEPVLFNNEVYRFYPKIRQKDIGEDTSNKFIDTLNMCNLFLGAIGGDYDGDQVTVKIPYTKEANAELENYMNSNKFFLNLGGINIRESSNEAIQAMYNLTLILPEDKAKITKKVE